MKCSTSALKSVSRWKEKPMGAALSFLGQKLFASSTLISARFENISCCTSVAAVHPPIVHRKGGFLKKRMTTIYVDSRKRVAGSDSDFEVDLGKSLHLQSDARLYKIRLADRMLGPSFVSGGQQVFEFVKMMARNKVYLRCAQLANASQVLGKLGDDMITLKSGVGTIVETGSDDGRFMGLRGPVTLRHMRFRLTDLDGNVRLRGSSLSFVLYLDHV